LFDIVAGRAKKSIKKYRDDAQKNVRQKPLYLRITFGRKDHFSLDKIIYITLYTPLFNFTVSFY
jgi:hypothetical protein